MYVWICFGFINGILFTLCMFAGLGAGNCCIQLKRDGAMNDNAHRPAAYPTYLPAHLNIKIQT